MGVFLLCNYIVACRIGAVGFMFVYVHMCTFGLCIYIVSMFVLSFLLEALGWVVVNHCELIALYKIFYFLFVFFLCECYQRFICFCYQELVRSDFLSYICYQYPFFIVFLIVLLFWLMFFHAYCKTVPIIIMFCYIQMACCCLSLEG